MNKKAEDIKRVKNWHKKFNLLLKKRLKNRKKEKELINTILGKEIIL
jgi:hypothetical protein